MTATTRPDPTRKYPHDPDAPPVWYGPKLAGWRMLNAVPAEAVAQHLHITRRQVTNWEARREVKAEVAERHMSAVEWLVGFRDRMSRQGKAKLAAIAVTEAQYAALSAIDADGTVAS